MAKTTITTILIVDDDKRIRETLRLMLKALLGEDLKFEEASSLKEAKEAAKVILSEDDYIDIAFIDVELPDGLGFELMEEIQGFAFVIAMSGRASEHEDSCFQNGARTIVGKPAILQADVLKPIITLVNWGMMRDSCVFHHSGADTR